MLPVGAVIVCVWACLLGTAYVARAVARLSRLRSALLVAAAYLVLCGLDLAWFGLNRSGLLGAFGMLLPCAAASLLAVLLPAVPAAR